MAVVGGAAAVAAEQFGGGALPFPYNLNGPSFLVVYGLLTGASLLAAGGLQRALGRKGRVAGGLVMGLVWLLGVTRLIQGVGAGRPVGFLICSLLLVSMALVTIPGSNDR
ncbi:MAG: hypothetical protein VKK99_06540 [Cyanobacteriota bacterium]|nr:hypothetical protein [Cyanobacteriota bacterium]